MHRAKAVILMAAVVTLGMGGCAPRAAQVGQEPRIEVVSQRPEAAAPIELPEAAVKPRPRPEPRRELPTPPRIALEGEDKYIILNFDNTDIKTIIATFSELLGINYIVQPGISGSVTIQSYKKFPTDSLFQIFQTLLEINGLTAVREGEFYKIVPIDTAKQQAISIEHGADPGMNVDSTFVTHLMPLQNVKASDTATILRSLMPRGTDLIVYEPANMLIVTAQPRTLEKFLKIIEVLDVTEAESEAIRTYVYYVENGQAATLEEILKTVYNAEGEVRKSAVTTGTAQTAALPASPSTSAARRTTTRPAQTQAVTSVTTDNPLPGEIGAVTITAYEDINALLIKCSPRTYLTLLEVLKKIDVPPRQVLIEVLIAQISLSDSTQFGLEWLAKSSRGDTYGYVGSSVATPPIITTEHPGGVFASVVSGVISGTEYSTVVEALEATTNFKVLASPRILAMDNQDAEIKIGKEIPTATSTTASSEGTTTSSQIEYKTVGTILTVTPHITEKGNVSMKLSVEKSDTGSSTTLGSGTFPDFSTNKAMTSAVVADGHTLIIAGLIDEKTEEKHTGIPYLSNLPIIGPLFGTTSEKTDRTELILMVTPRVVHDERTADAISEEYTARIRFISESIPDPSDRRKIRTLEFEEKPAQGGASGAGAEGETEAGGGPQAETGKADGAGTEGEGKEPPERPVSPDTPEGKFIRPTL